MLNSLEEIEGDQESEQSKNSSNIFKNKGKDKYSDGVQAILNQLYKQWKNLIYSFKSTRMSVREQVAQLCLIGG